jgi:exopolysaccharide biosynthesis polyprenyl glycosylphosphotransferase
LEISEGKNIELFFIPNILNIITSHTSSFEIAGTPVIRLKSVAFSGWQGFIKRSFDLVLSFMGLILLSPLLFTIAFLIKISSKGPVYYRQKRVGMDGNEFTMLKFRSMILDAESKTGPVWAKENDPRVTWIGKFLRRSSLDELPQLMNVLKGEMSVVGPRPERKVFVDEFQQRIPKYAERHRVRSGVTGWAQVNGLRGQSPIEDRTHYDVFYIENWSLWFDIKIILMTMLAIVRGENAY